ncbi:MAG: hypothetical protein RL578_286 [Chloroflexota bacterium]|jgi:hypothetical protein
MVRTVVCGAADEGSIPSGHPTLSLAALRGVGASPTFIQLLFGPGWKIKTMPTQEGAPRT